MIGSLGGKRRSVVRLGRVGRIVVVGLGCWSTVAVAAAAVAVAFGVGFVVLMKRPVAVAGAFAGVDFQSCRRFLADLVLLLMHSCCLTLIPASSVTCGLSEMLGSPWLDLADSILRRILRQSVDRSADPGRHLHQGLS